MSLLIDALKKSEEKLDDEGKLAEASGEVGEVVAEAATAATAETVSDAGDAPSDSDSDTADTSVVAAADQSVAESAGSAENKNEEPKVQDAAVSAAPAASSPGLSLKAVAGAGAGSAPKLSTAKPATGTGTATSTGAGGPSVTTSEQPRPRVEAGKVFNAGALKQRAGGQSRGLIALVGLVVLIGGGGFWAQQEGLIDLDSLLGTKKANIIATSQDSSSESQINFADSESADDEGVVNLPRPIIDVQKSVDFAALRSATANSGNTRDEVNRTIRIITRLDTVGSGALQNNPTGLSDSAQIIQDEFIPAEEKVASPDLSFDEKLALYENELNADEILAQKAVLDALTGSEEFIDLKINGRPPENKIVAEVAQLSDQNVQETDAVAPEVQQVAQSQSSGSDSGGKKALLTRSLQDAERNNLLNDAKDYYDTGQLLEAEHAYRKVLSSSETDLDALRGLAQVAVQSGRFQMAADVYLRILEYYPDDVIAVSDLINLATETDVYSSERKLRALLSSNGLHNARIHFTLGNLYADKGDYAAAQLAYFEAFRLDQTNADYAYNLAVSLDYLNKPSIAKNYYQEALNLYQHTPVGFDPSDVRSRLAELSNAGY